MEELSKQFDEAKRIQDREIENIEKRRPLKGCALIISNPLNDKSRCHEKDNKLMTELWKDTLECHLVGQKAHTGLKAKEIEKYLSDLAVMNSEAYDYLIVVISTHGGVFQESHPRKSNRVRFQGHDKLLVDEREALYKFNETSSQWHDKPKIFLLDYCRGESPDRGIATTKSHSEKRTKIEEDILPPYIIPAVTNSFIVYATHYDQVALPKRLTTAVRDVFKENWNDESVSSMLTMVNAKMKEFSDHGIKTMSVFKSTAITDFHLYQTAIMGNEQAMEREIEITYNSAD